MNSLLAAIDLRVAAGSARSQIAHQAAVERARSVFLSAKYDAVTVAHLASGQASMSSMFENYVKPVPVLRALCEVMLSMSDAGRVHAELDQGLLDCPASPTGVPAADRAHARLLLAKARLLAEQDDHYAAAVPARGAVAFLAAVVDAQPRPQHYSLLADALVESVILGRAGTRWWSALETNEVAGTADQIRAALERAHALYAKAGNMYGVVHAELRLATIVRDGASGIDPARFDDPYLFGLTRQAGRVVRREEPLPAELALLRCRLLVDDDDGRRRVVRDLDVIAGRTDVPLVAARARARAASTRIKILRDGGRGDLLHALGPLLAQGSDPWTAAAEETAEPAGLAVAYCTADGPLKGRLADLSDEDLTKLRSLAVVLTTRYKTWVQAFAHAAVAGIDGSLPDKDSASSATLHGSAARARFQQMRDRKVGFDEGDETVEASVASEDMASATQNGRWFVVDRALERAIAATALLREDDDPSGHADLADRVAILHDRLSRTTAPESAPRPPAPTKDTPWTT